MRKSSIILLLLCTWVCASDESALLKAIAAHPGEDTPRLAYADYLDEHGRADQARFIRLQIERANLPLHHPRRSELETEEEVILRKHRKAWLPQALQDGDIKATWERGFVSGIELSTDLLGEGDVRRAIEQLPHLKELSFINDRGNAVAFAGALQNASQLRSIRLRGLSPEAVAALSRAPFTGLERLTIRRELPNAGLNALLDSTFAPRLIEFGAPLSDSQLHQIANHVSLTKLKALSIGQANPNELRNRKYLSELRALTLDLGGGLLPNSKLQIARERADDLRNFRRSVEFQGLHQLTIHVDARDPELVTETSARRPALVDRGPP